MIVTDELRPGARRSLTDLLRSVTAHDGVSPWDEAARLALRGEAVGPARGARHLLVPAPLSPEEPGADGAPLVGAVSILADGTVQGMVAPAHRGRGIGADLLRRALALRPDAGVWAHGGLPEAVRLLARHGLQCTRELLTMSRALDPAGPALPVPAVPEGVVLGTLGSRTGAEGDDAGLDPALELDREADEWVRVNAIAFADHPEQGRMTRADLDARRAEPWFDPADLHVAREGAQMLGFVWVKRAPDGSSAELYAVGTDPAASGRGIAGALTAAALADLQRTGVREVELYVEGGNAGARRLYERAGFRVSGKDLQFRLPAEASAAPEAAGAEHGTEAGTA